MRNVNVINYVNVASGQAFKGGQWTIDGVVAATGFMNIIGTPTVNINGTVPVSIAANQNIGSGLVYQGGGTWNVYSTGYFIVASWPAMTVSSGAAYMAGQWNVNSISQCVPTSGFVDATVKNNINVASGFCVQGGQWNINSITQVVATTGVVDVRNTVPTSGFVDASLRPLTLGGLNYHTTVCDATTNFRQVKTTAGQIYGWYLSSISPYPRYIKIYDAASGRVGTDTPMLNLLIPGNTTGGAGANQMTPMGIQFASGISYCVTSGLALLDTSTILANECSVNLAFK